MFGWLTDPVNSRAVAALIASATAIIIAFFAYAWQKRKDRAHLLAQEKREAYRRFLEESTSYFGRVALATKVEDSSTLQEHYLRVVAVSADLIIYAPVEVIEKCQKYAEKLFEYSDRLGRARKLPGYDADGEADHSSIYPDVKRLRREAFLSIRQDLTGASRRISEKAVDAFFVKTKGVENSK